MLFAAATTDIVQEFLLTLGFTCEVRVSRPQRGVAGALAADGNGVSVPVIRAA
jgi:hypothetical protein